MNRNLYLTQHEQTAVEMLAQGKSYLTTVLALGRSRFRIGAFFTQVRKKTGIESTKDAQASRDYLEAFERARHSQPSAAQLDVIKRIALTGKAPPEMSEEALRAVLRSAAIFATDPAEQRKQCGTYLAHQTAKDVPEFTALEKQVLRFYAQGQFPWYISKALDGKIDPPAVERIIERGCKSLRVVYRGRGVQRRLLGIALDALETPQKDPLDDY